MVGNGAALGVGQGYANAGLWLKLQLAHGGLNPIGKGLLQGCLLVVDEREVEGEFERDLLHARITRHLARRLGRHGSQQNTQNSAAYYFYSQSKLLAELLFFLTKYQEIRTENEKFTVIKLSNTTKISDTTTKLLKNPIQHPFCAFLFPKFKDSKL